MLLQRCESGLGVYKGFFKSTGISECCTMRLIRIDLSARTSHHMLYSYRFYFKFTRNLTLDTNSHFVAASGSQTAIRLNTF